jgi:TRAP transporter TAXI family solute receptor
MSGLVAYNDRTGTGPFTPDGPDRDLRIISNLWLSTDHFVVQKEVAKSGTIFDFLALRREPVSLGTTNSGRLVKNEAMLNNLGASIDEFELASLGYEESAKAFIGGEIVGMNLSGGVPVPAMTETLEVLGDDAVILEFNDDQLRAADAGLGLWVQDTIPAGTYPNQPNDILTIGTPIFWWRAPMSTKPRCTRSPNRSSITSTRCSRCIRVPRAVSRKRDSGFRS